MTFEVAVVDKGSHTRVTVSGHPSIGQLLSLVHVLGLESAEWERDAVLVDLRGVLTEFSRGEQARIGEEAAASLGHISRIASLVRPEKVTRVSERAAQRSGTNVCVFDNEGEALAWLLGEVRVGAGAQSNSSG